MTGIVIHLDTNPRVVHFCVACGLPVRWMGVGPAEFDQYVRHTTGGTCVTRYGGERAH